MACVCSLYNARSEWLFLGRYSPVHVMPTDRLRTCKSKANCQIINKLLTSNVRSLFENLDILAPTARSIRQDLGLRFFCKGLTLG